MSSEAELIAELRQDERERHARVSTPLIRKAMGDALPRTAEVPEALVLFNDWRDKALVDALGVVISITRRQLRGEFGERSSSCPSCER